MSEQNPYQILGVKEDASFEEIQDAKQRLIQQNQQDGKIIESIDAAYDAIIMDRLRQRQEGKIKVPERIRFPEREQPSQSPLNVTPLPLKTSPSWLKNLLDTPSSKDILLPAGVFVALASIAVFAIAPSASFIPFLLTLGIFANAYFLNRKEGRFWRSVLITLIGLIVGISMGAVIRAGLGNSMIPLDEQQLYGITTFFIFWLSSSFLK